MRTIQTRDNTGIYYKNSGTGRAIVLRHSWPLSNDVWRLYILSMIVLFAAVSLMAAIANAQEPAASSSNAAGPTGGWWSPVGSETATARQFRISMAEPVLFKTSDSSQILPSLRTTSTTTESMDGQIASLQSFGQTFHARGAKPSLLADSVSPTPGSFPSLLQAKYATWESGLADSRSPVNVGGASVYPLFQINYASWHLPVTLYISSLRDSDTR